MAVNRIKCIFILIFMVSVGCASRQSADQAHGEKKAKEIKLVDQPAKAETQDVGESVPAARPAVNQKTNEIMSIELQKWIENKNWTEIKKYCYEQLELDSVGNALCWIWLGLVSWFEGKPKLARYYILRAIEKNADKYIAYNNLALISVQEQKNFDALKNFRMAVLNKVDSKRSHAEINMAMLLSQYKDYRKALAAIDQIEDGNITDPIILSNLAVIYMNNDRLDRAEKMFKKALSIDKHNKGIILNYAIYQIHYKKNFEQGRKLLDQLLFLGVDPDLQLIFSELEKKLEKLER
ncbi:MAG: tetratricopeptide repeat protein [Bdellovibrionaceae bacterium]|nr:tetratricopeptide repeat protein [Pseudobdellovibrionaceae bacterium]MDW8189581.1 tetratricopeptide repeat protein [Pseudobdellovibrionaceae bacterium]